MRAILADHATGATTSRRTSDLEHQLLPRAVGAWRNCCPPCFPTRAARGVGARWLVIGGDDLFFTVTKRIIDRLHGVAGDGEDLSESDRRHYEAVLAPQAGQLRERIGPAATSSFMTLRPRGSRRTSAPPARP